jgi:hypothetical protein
VKRTVETVPSDLISLSKEQGEGLPVKLVGYIMELGLLARCYPQFFTVVVDNPSSL